MAHNDGSCTPDVVLDVDGVKFSCCRQDLADQSPYFRAMFSNHFVEKNQEVVKIQGVDGAAMDVLLQWMKDSSILDSLQGENILVVLQTAAMLHMENLQRACEDMMVKRWLSVDTCLQTAAAADQLSLPSLHHKASALALWEFSKVRHTEAFLNLSSAALVQYLGQDALSTTEDEFEVFEAVSSWIEHNIEERHSDTLNTLACVRFGFVSTSDVYSMLSYFCISSNLVAQDHLKCILLLKKGREPRKLSGDQEIVPEQTMKPSGQGSDGVSCDTSNRPNGNPKLLHPFTPTQDVGDNIPMNAEDGEPVSDDTDDTRRKAVYSSETIALAKRLLALPARHPPVVACTIAHSMKNESLEESDDLPDYGHLKKAKNPKTRFVRPYIYYWDGEKSNQPIPYLHLSKIDQSPVEAVGYTVLGKGQDLYVLGGEYLLGSGDWNKSVWKYDVWRESWSFETSLPVPRRHHSVVCLDDDMYVIGGYGRYRVIMDSVDRYNFITKSWNKCAPLPTTLGSAAACVHHSLIFVIASQVFCYQPITNTWVTFSEVTLPPASSYNKAMSYENDIYLTGLYSCDLMRFDPNGEKKIQLIGQFQNVAGNACLVRDKIYIFTTDADGRPCTEMYDITKKSFHILWHGPKNEISFRKSGGSFSLVLY